MLDGNYNPNFNWKSVESPFLNLYTSYLNFRNHDYDTCGTGALSLLTNISPFLIDKERKKLKKKHWNDNSIIRFLRKRHFQVVPLTKHLITSSPKHLSYYDLPREKVTRYHCLLLNSLVCEGEASYFVAHNGLIYHNFSIEELHPLFFVNRPTQTAYIISHEKWRIS